jgi:hypothetical protein
LTFLENHLKKRVLLAAGLWMKTSTNSATRIVLYRTLKGEFVIHNQNYEGSDPIGHQISYSSGHYFGKSLSGRGIV